ncbi:uncharacterized protein LOC131203946 [Ahaetulla prasina]|uniref:uncharacterized protein LOC131203946 n=1 Tax=Ahaetulla prasina TaxID=499056 RepID=UPI0026480C62|nr:uncharacterized protein LOC131203946 [Ahaetulla prasina]
MTVTIDHAATRIEEKIFTNPTIEGVPCRLEVDTGSAITIMSWDTFVKALPHIAKRKLQKQRLRVQDYQGNRIPVRGTTTVEVKYGTYEKTLPITLVEGTLPSLLGLDWFRALGMGVTGVHRSGCNLQNALMEEFADVFEDRLADWNREQTESIEPNRDLSEPGEVQRHPQAPREDSRSEPANNPGPDGREEELRGTKSPSGKLDSTPESELRRSGRVRRRPTYLQDYVEK